ncbi:MAG: tripartite tricarboxylate transporter permease [Methanomassiliicoccales archaeon]|nr:tripartite tricarboxylate transporter permease [Methanomassiliicoccales archaeon]MDD1756260.1 tripartite tricarboxylate transporter permease [Methanomassiliicoccales archaeon]
MDPGVLVMVVGVSAAGGVLGASCALIPGFHANTLALVLLALLGPLASGLSYAASLLGCHLSGTLLFAAFLVAAATAHSFVDFVPSAFLGAPAEDTVLCLLPAHRLLKSGKGMEGIRYAAFGSLCGGLLGILLSVPLQLLLRPPSPLIDLLDASVPFLLVGVAALLVLTERGHEEPRAHIDVRDGQVLPAGELCICHPIPVDGGEAKLSGKVTRRGARSFHLATPFGDWKVVSGPLPRPKGFVTVQGVWVVRKGSARSKLMALAVLALSGLLGFVVMNSYPPLAGTFQGWGQSLLFPLLSGLFAFPALLSAASSAPIPPQAAAGDQRPPFLPALTGTFAGFLSGWMPGVTSTIGTVIGSCFVPRPKDEEQGTKEYILMLSAVGTSSVVFSLLALCIEGSGRSGAMLALKSAVGQEGMGSLSSFPGAWSSSLLVAVLVASAIGYHATLWAGGLFSKKAAGRDMGRLNLIVILVLTALILAFNGLPGLLVVGVATLVGLLPPSLGVRRVHLTGCLLLPLLLFYIGIESAAIGLLW